MYTYICIHTYVYIHSVKDGKQSDSTFVSQHGSTYIHMYTHLHTPCILSRNQKTIRFFECKPTWKHLYTYVYTPTHYIHTQSKSEDNQILRVQANMEATLSTEDIRDMRPKGALEKEVRNAQICEPVRI